MASSTRFASSGSSPGRNIHWACAFLIRRFAWIISAALGISPTDLPETPMWPREEVVRALRARGELWEPSAGITALRGDAAALFRDLERAIGAVCGLETSDEWRVPPAIGFETLARAEYFASFPHWLTLTSHLSDDEEMLRRVAEHNEPALVMKDAS